MKETIHHRVTVLKVKIIGGLPSLAKDRLRGLSDCSGCGPLMEAGLYSVTVSAKLG